MAARLFRVALVLGLVSAVGPFAIDMYLPALPSVGRSFGAATGAVQMSLTAFFIALAAGQLFYGPLSDTLGRKLPLHFGLVLFALSSIGCALAPSIGVLIGFRFVQGLGACAGMVIPRAVVRDLHTGVEATRLMSMLMLVVSISPLLAPLTGSLVIQIAGWRAVFWVVTVAAMIGMALLSLFLTETRPAAKRAGSSLAGAFKAYGQLLTDRHFLALTFIGAFGFACFFSYLANSPFVLITHYGLTPTLYGVFFAINAASFFATAQLNARLGTRFGLRRLIRTAAVVFAAAMLSVFALFAAGVDRLDVLVSLLFIGFGSLGLILPTSSVLALEEHGAIAGAASSLMGTLQFVVGAVVMVAASRFMNGTPLPMVSGIAACATVSCVLAQVSLWRPQATATEMAVE